MPPRPAPKPKELFELPLFDFSGRRVPPLKQQRAAHEPSPLVDAIVKYLDSPARARSS